MSLRSTARRHLARLPIRRLLPKRRVLLHGFYGAGNVGDEAILEASRRLLVDLTGVQPTVLAWNSSAVASATGLKAMPWQRIMSLRGAWDLATAGAYLVGGGGVLKDFGRDGRSTLIPNWLAPLEAAQDAGLPTATWFVGVENIDREDSRDALRSVLGRCRIVSVRDQDSAELLQMIGVEAPIIVGPDPVVTLLEAGRRARTVPERPRIAVCLREWQTRGPFVADGDRFEVVVGEIAHALDRAVDEWDASITFVPFRTSPGDDDVSVSRRVADRMARKDDVRVLQDALTWQEAFEYIDTSDIVLAMRLHALIAATSMGIPAIALEYMPKVRGFMRDAGLEAHVLSLEELDADGIGTRLSAVLAGYATLSRRLADSAAKRVAQTRDVARAVVSGLGVDE